MGRLSNKDVENANIVKHKKNETSMYNPKGFLGTLTVIQKS